MRKGVFRRIFLLYALVFFLAAVSVEVYITSAVRENYIDNLRGNLSVEIELISRILAREGDAQDAACRQFKKDTGARVTVVAGDGKVIGDSDSDSSRMDNHLHRTEIEKARLFGAGMAIRYSDTLKYDLLYVAKKISYGESFVRLAVPLKDVDHAIDLLRARIILVVLLVLVVTSLVSLWQTEHLRRLLRQITDFSKSLSRGEIDRRLYLKNAGEFNEIAENLTLMSGKLQEVLARSEEERSRLNVILRSVPDALLITDAKGHIVLASLSAKEFFGDVPMTGMQFIEVVRSSDAAGLVDRVRRTLSSGTTSFRIETPDEKYLSVRVSPLFYPGQELSGFVAIFHDITQIEKLEQVRKDFVANVSHEIKTPITAITGFAETLLEGALDDREQAEGFLRRITANGERINSLVDDLMTISRIELGVIRVEKTTVDVEDVFMNVMELFRAKAAEKGLFLKVSQSPDIREISADRNRLIQILTNLVDNAVKFTDSGGITFGIGQEAGKPFLFVEDTGVGIPSRHLPRLGERFYRVDPARSRKMGGTGLGLAIVKHLVRAHGWSMHIESSPGKGSKVIIML